jgi:hypothetical protein
MLNGVKEHIFCMDNVSDLQFQNEQQPATSSSSSQPPRNPPSELLSSPPPYSPITVTPSTVIQINAPTPAPSQADEAEDEIEEEIQNNP